MCCPGPFTTRPRRGAEWSSRTPSWLPWMNWRRPRTCNLFCDCWPLQTDNAPTPPRCDSPAPNHRSPKPSTWSMRPRPSRRPERSPFVRLGHIGFDDLVVALWAHLPPEIRRGFAFRLSFGPHRPDRSANAGAGMHPPCHRGALVRASGHPHRHASQTGLPRCGDPERSCRSNPAHRVHAADGSTARHVSRPAVGRAGLPARHRRTFVGATRRRHQADREAVAEFGRRATPARSALPNGCAMPCPTPGPKRSCDCGTSSFSHSPSPSGSGRQSRNGWPRTAMPRIRTPKCSPSSRTPQPATPLSRNGEVRF